MAEPVPARTFVPAGTHRCLHCGNTVTIASPMRIQPCRSCGHGQWETVPDGDSVADPYPGPRA
jgi:predicted  nucleic acid-binding Zn-ribbon protein